MKQICVLASGGIESSVLLATLASKGHRLAPLYVSHGFLWERAELHWLKKFLRAISNRGIEPLTIISFPITPLYQNHWSLTGEKVPGFKSKDQAVYLPGRNILLLSVASVFCAQRSIPKMAVGVLKTNPFPDGSPKLLRQIAARFSQGLSKPISIDTPFAKLTKEEVISLGRQWPLELTFSCLRPRNFQHCGRCNKCAERRKAFRTAGLEDPTIYR
jgi:7-cyano-7-deazaguanine synthase